MKRAGYWELISYARQTLPTGSWDPEPNISDEELENLRLEAFQNSAAFTQMDKIADTFSLYPSERYLLMIALLPDLEPSFSPVMDILGGRDGYPSFSMIQRMWHMRGEDESLPVRKAFLTRFFLEDRENQSLRLRPYVVSFLQGQMEEQMMSEKPILLSGEIQWVAKELYDRPALYYIYGPKGIGRHTCFQQMNLDPVIWIHSGEEAEEKLFLAAVQGLPAGIDAPELWTGEGNQSLSDYEPYLNSLALIGDEPDDWEPFSKFIPLKLQSLSLEERYHFWVQFGTEFQTDKTIDCRRLANQYDLTPGEIQSAYRWAEKLAFAGNAQNISQALLQDAIHMVRKTDYGGMATSIPCVYTWEDLVLPEKQKCKLREACQQMEFRHLVLEQWGLGKRMAYGTGITLIFAGPPGTGKTMAAQVLANQLQMELRKIDLAAVVSKYVGETEKNLKKIFNDASRSRAVLFFDEADVLFSKRTDVRDAGDKYSNMEAAFLLQEMENYEGVAILATNLVQNMDEAFKRRMRFLVEFPFPDEHMRLEIWKRAIPETVPTDGELDLQFLARQFTLSGSGIRNAVYNSAFLAAAGNIPLSMEHLMAAIYREFEKSGKKLSPQDGGAYGALLEV